MLNCYIKEKHRDVRHQNLRNLVDSLPVTLRNTKAKNTTDTYVRGLGIWNEWIANFEEMEFPPANSLHVAFCIQSLIQSNLSYAKVKQFFYGLKWVHKILGLRDPCKTSLVITVNQDAKESSLS